MGNDLINDLDLDKIKIAYVEMHKYFEFLSDATDKLDSKLITLFSSLSIILTLFGFIGIDFSLQLHFFNIIILSFIITVFIFFCYHIYQGLIPKKYSYPFEGTLEAVDYVCLSQESLYDVYDQLISSLDKRLKILIKINSSKSNNLKSAYFAYLLELLLVFILFISSFQFYELMSLLK